MIGIIGGVGPTAGADLLQKITEETKALRDQDHLPVVLFSLPGEIEDRSDYLNGKEKNNPGPAMARIALQLEKLGASIAAIPCNTAHAPRIFNCVREELKNAGSKIRMVHLIEENIAYLKKNFKKGTGIAVLSTTGTYEQKIYSGEIEKAGFRCIVPEEDIQRDLVHAAIYHPAYGIKATNGKTTPVARAQLQFVMDLMKREGAEVVLLGCTELPLAFEECTYKEMVLIDATRILARAIIREWDEERLKEDSYGKFLTKK